MKGIITQSNYIPWVGYFYSINNVDIFAVYDEMQYTKQDWRNRNLIKTPKGLVWLTIPIILNNYHQKTNETKIANHKWNINHWNLIKANYSGTKYFKEISSWLEPLYRNCKYDYLTDINLLFINSINNYLNIKTKIIHTPKVDLSLERNKRLVSICKNYNITDYYLGPSGKNYLQSSYFSQENIHVSFWDYSNFDLCSCAWAKCQSVISPNTHFIEIIITSKFST